MTTDTELLIALADAWRSDTGACTRTFPDWLRLQLRMAEVYPDIVSPEPFRRALALQLDDS